MRPLMIGGGQPTHPRFVIYGATGYTGRMLAQMAVTRGIRPLLAGRNATRLAAVAEPLGLPYCAVHVGERGRLVQLLQGATALLNLAGPFSATWRPLTLACLRVGTHYLDIAGDLGTYRAVHALDQTAREGGGLLLPGAAFLVAGTECLALHLARQLPTATRLSIGLSPSHRLSPGSIATFFESVRFQTQVLRRGRLCTIPLRTQPWGRGPDGGSCWMMPLPFADLWAAHLATGIGDIDVGLVLRRHQRRLLCGSRLLSPALGVSAVRRFASEVSRSFLSDGVAAFWSTQPKDQVLVGEATDPQGNGVAAVLATPESYSFTCEIALWLIQCVLDTPSARGFATPAQVGGEGFLLGLRGVHLWDLAAHAVATARRGSPDGDARVAIREWVQ